MSTILRSAFVQIHHAADAQEIHIVIGSYYKALSIMYWSVYIILNIYAHVLPVYQMMCSERCTLYR